MTRENAISWITKHFDGGDFFNDLTRRVGIPSESQNPARVKERAAYLTEGLKPALDAMGFTAALLENSESNGMPFLLAERIEDPELTTVLIYGHGDVILGMEADWENGLSPWRLTEKGDRWYGRGAADNKGQHSIHIASLAAVMAVRGRLGFNCKIFVETGEEMGSPGLYEAVRTHQERLKSNVLIASDGPRLTPDRPTLFGGSRGVFNFDLSLVLREGGHHSGNWGGLLANPGIILAHAIASMVDRKGQILVPELRPHGIPPSVRRALAEIEVTGEGGPAIDPQWGEPGLSLAEKVYGWSTLEVLAFVCGNPGAPVHAIPSRAWARCHMRFVADQDPAEFLGAIRRHLKEQGFGQIEVSDVPGNYTKATRLDPDNPWAQWAIRSIEKTCGVRPAFLPSLGGTIPNDVFSDLLGLPTLWVPHSYGGCSQHAPNEHLLAPIVREGLQIMTGLYWDLPEKGRKA
jgi:acetylornithine deacetylase/succinyl-diaminopimelate desuccinylase-like protein